MIQRLIQGTPNMEEVAGLLSFFLSESKYLCSNISSLWDCSFGVGILCCISVFETNNSVEVLVEGVAVLLEGEELLEGDALLEYLARKSDLFFSAASSSQWRYGICFPLLLVAASITIKPISYCTNKKNHMSIFSLICSFCNTDQLAVEQDRGNQNVNSHSSCFWRLLENHGMLASWIVRVKILFLLHVVS